MVNSAKIWCGAVCLANLLDILYNCRRLGNGNYNFHCKNFKTNKTTEEVLLMNISKWLQSRE